MEEDIVNDVVDEVTSKSSIRRLIYRWGGRIFLFLISGAYVIGQLQMAHLSKITDFQKSIDDVKKNQIEMKQDMKDGFNKIDLRFNKVYDDGYKEFNDYQEYNNKQLSLIIDYSKTDKDLLKRVLDLNKLEKNKNVENELQQAKNHMSQTSTITVRKIDSNLGIKDLDYKEIITTVSINNNDTTYNVFGSTLNFYNKIKNMNYNINEINPSTKYRGLYDFTYKK